MYLNFLLKTIQVFLELNFSVRYIGLGVQIFFGAIFDKFDLKGIFQFFVGSVDNFSKREYFD